MVGYLGQLWDLDPRYALTVLEALPENSKTHTGGFKFVEVQNNAKGAVTAGKDAKVRPSQAWEKLVGNMLAVPATFEMLKV